MRRNDREVTDKNRIIEILEKSKVIHIGIHDGEFPYVLPLHYGFELSGEKIIFYMHGAKQGHKVDLINSNSKVGFVVECDVEPFSGGDVPCRYGSFYASIMGKGCISLVEDDSEKIHGLEVLMKTQTNRSFHFDKEMADSVCVMKIECSSYTAKSIPK